MSIGCHQGLSWLVCFLKLYFGVVQLSIVSLTEQCWRDWWMPHYDATANANTIHFPGLIYCDRAWLLSLGVQIRLLSLMSLKNQNFRDTLILVFVNENCCLCISFAELYFFHWLLAVVSLAILVAVPFVLSRSWTLFAGVLKIPRVSNAFEDYTSL